MKLILVGFLILLFLIAFVLFKTSVSQRMIAQPEPSEDNISVQYSTEQIISNNRPLMDVKIGRNEAKKITITTAKTPSYLVFEAAINAFNNCNSMLRMIVDRKRLESFKGDNYVEIKFKYPVNLSIATGGTLSVSNIVVPLSEQQTAPAWNFYYSPDGREWFALRWTNPNLEMLRGLKQEAQKLF
jgi:hypothetical protein